MVIIPEFAAGHVNNVYSYPEFVNFEQNNIRIDNPWTLNIWTLSYTIINTANNIINPGTQHPRRRYSTGEARPVYSRS